MRIAIFGAAGRTGRHVCEALAARGHDLHPVTRRDAPDLPGTPERIDPADAEAVRALAARCDAVVNAMASGKGNPAGSRLAAALAGRDGLRYVSVGGGAVDAPGDAKGAPDRIVSWLARTMTGMVVTDRQAELDLLRARGGGLVWTMLRPPRLTDKDATGAYRLTTDKPASTQIARADLARAVADLVESGEHAGAAPFVAW